jgi:hypothetical protein
MKRLIVVLIGLGLVVTSCAGVGPSGRGESVPPSSPPESAQVPPPSAPSGSLEASPADGTIAYAASELSRALANDDRFASVEVLNGSEIVVHWDGPVDSKLRNLLDRFPQLQISVETTHCSPGKLSEYAGELVTTDPLVNIAAPAPDGSSLLLTLDESAKATADIASLERRYSEAIGCPVHVKFGDIEPAGL